MSLKLTLNKLPLLTLLIMTACAVGPDYERPATDAPKAYKEVGAWTPAQPRDDVDRGMWWKVFKDPVLDKLEEQIDISNQNLKQAEAAQILGVTRPRVSDVINRKSIKFTIDALVDMLARTGKRVRLSVH